MFIVKRERIMTESEILMDKTKRRLELNQDLNDEIILSSISLITILIVLYVYYKPLKFSKTNC